MPVKARVKKGKLTNLIVAGFLAAVLAFLVNRTGQRVLGKAAAVYLAPPVEEIAKTYLALLLGASLLGTHLFFGVLEAIDELLGIPSQRSAAAQGRKSTTWDRVGTVSGGRGPGRQTIWKTRPPSRAKAVSGSLTAHLLFGLITLWGGQWFGSWGVGVAMGALVHFLWNASVLEYFQ